MRIIVTENYNDMSKQAAGMVAGQVYLKADSILGLATGSTPVGMYQNLVAMHRDCGLDFSNVISFNLDEYSGLPQSNDQSYYFFMFQHLFDHINIKKENIHLPNGMAANIETECLEYERKIKQSGGIDLQILGIGNNGHIGFNEPGDHFTAATQEVALDESTIAANARFFENAQQVPRKAVSMGIKTIMQAKRIVLLASGESKAQAVYQACRGPITPQVPASVLQLHPDVTVIADQGAAAQLR